MAFVVDIELARSIEQKLLQTGKSFDDKTMGAVLKEAAVPMLEAAKNEAPVGKTKIRSTTTRATRTGRLSRDGTYDRGGATKRDTRIRLVAGKGTEIVRALVGVSKASGKVGWRTHLITRANKHRRVADDFLGRAEARTEDLVKNRLGLAAQTIIDRETNKI